jgi:hypothetical protein
MEINKRVKNRPRIREKEHNCDTKVLCLYW